MKVLLQDLDKVLRQARVFLEKVGLSEELRGWRWDTPPVEPPIRGISVSVSEVSGRYCESMRDIYLKYVEGVEAKPTLVMREGKVYHRILEEVLTRVKSIVYGHGIIEGAGIFSLLLEQRNRCIENIIKQEIGPIDSEKSIENVVKKASKLWNYLSLKYSAAIDNSRASHRKIGLDALVAMSVPQIVEYRVDGSPLGLSSELSVDVFQPSSIVFEVKTGRKRWFHKLATTGYAMAFEASRELPINIGVVMYMHFDERGLPQIKMDYHMIDDEWRRRFLETRDTILEIITNERDPGKPPRCYEYCPLKEYCG
ncbi:MAG: type I-A CRISPR-associated protein Cas4/Csa1 [Thermoproteales archaeon]|nr:type I-A CRISPR-associated protein Cas4/Csa1 [Thermoproteales archaeon]